jgi:hypothetical protein
MNQGTLCLTLGPTFPAGIGGPCISSALAALRATVRVCPMPWGVVALGNLHRRVRQQDGDAFHGHAIEEQFDRQRVPEPVRVASFHSGDLA